MELKETKFFPYEKTMSKSTRPVKGSIKKGRYSVTKEGKSVILSLAAASPATMIKRAAKTRKGIDLFLETKKKELKCFFISVKVKLFVFRYLPPPSTIRLK